MPAIPAIAVSMRRRLLFMRVSLVYCRYGIWRVRIMRNGV
ncbi:Uncharacterised protein [Bordetella pertussis]|nr:Uncharacterised protein [Bordetella pertussis]CFN63551.1 Uncharacterised protein [Bordetella pertussis]CFO00562.1 Uncharacterised protein [Bordetella pertussis]CFO05572.1 Uncharacterised protein [Bordetella pertussis]CFO31406.1 Uncharacterised protein [Bordetella pertussis]